MEHPFFPTTTTRAEALRWLTIAEKLLSTRDLMGSKSFASRARDADPTLSQPDQILAVADTLLAGDLRIGNNQQDLYAILRLTPTQGRNAEHVASQYRSLALLLNPQKNKFPFAEQAFGLVLEAWTVLSDPSRKLMYDREIAFYSQPQQQQQIDQFGNSNANPIPTMHQNFNFFGSSSGGVTQPPHSQAAPAAHFPQVQVSSNSQVDPLATRSAREPQNFMNFTSGSSIVFGSGSGPGSKPSHEMMHKQAHDSYSTFSSNVAAAATPGANSAPGNANNEQPQEKYSNVGNKTSGHNVGENAGDGVEEDELEGVEVAEDGMDGTDTPLNNDILTFWTACPYCYYMYEYPRVYADCTIRCQNCKSAFQAVVIPSPPPIEDGREGYFCCWGFLPLGFSMENWEKNKGAASNWTPFSPMFTCPQPVNGGKGGKRKSSTPRIYVDDDEVFVDLTDSSESDDDDWNGDKEKRKKKVKTTGKGKGASGTPGRSTKKAQVDKGKNVSVQDGIASPKGVETVNNPEGGEVSKKGTGTNSRKQPGRAAKNFGKLDLNVECSNEAEEAAAPRANQGNGPARGEDDNIEGNGFFEGLDEFLSSLPILNVVGDDKVVKA